MHEHWKIAVIRSPPVKNVSFEHVFSINPESSKKIPWYKFFNFFVKLKERNTATFLKACGISCKERRCLFSNTKATQRKSHPIVRARKLSCLHRRRTKFQDLCLNQACKCTGSLCCRHSKEFLHRNCWCSLQYCTLR